MHMHVASSAAILTKVFELNTEFFPARPQREEAREAHLGKEVSARGSAHPHGWKEEGGKDGGTCGAGTLSFAAHFYLPLWGPSSAPAWPFCH